MASVDKCSNGTYLARWREYPRWPQKSRQFAKKGDAERFIVDESLGASAEDWLRTGAV